MPGNIANNSDRSSKGCHGGTKRCMLSDEMTESEDSILFPLPLLVLGVLRAKIPRKQQIRTGRLQVYP